MRDQVYDPNSRMRITCHVGSDPSAGSASPREPCRDTEEWEWLRERDMPAKESHVAGAGSMAGEKEEEGEASSMPVLVAART